MGVEVEVSLGRADGEGEAVAAAVAVSVASREGSIVGVWLGPSVGVADATAASSTVVPSIGGRSWATQPASAAPTRTASSAGPSQIV